MPKKTKPRPKLKAHGHRGNKPAASDDEIAEAYAIYVKCERNATQTAAKLGMATETLRYWIKKHETRLAREAEGQRPVGEAQARLENLSLLDLMEHAARELVKELLVKKRRATMQTVGSRLHVLNQDIQMFRGQPGVIKRTEADSKSVNLDLSRLTEAELLAWAALYRKADPTNGIEFAESKPVIMEGIEDDGRPAAPSSPQ